MDAAFGAGETAFLGKGAFFGAVGESKILAKFKEGLGADAGALLACPLIAFLGEGLLGEPNISPRLNEGLGSASRAAFLAIGFGAIAFGAAFLGGAFSVGGDPKIEESGLRIPSSFGCCFGILTPEAAASFFCRSSNSRALRRASSAACSSIFLRSAAILASLSAASFALRWKNVNNFQQNTTKFTLTCLSYRSDSCSLCSSSFSLCIFSLSSLTVSLFFFDKLASFFGRKRHIFKVSHDAVRNVACR